MASKKITIAFLQGGIIPAAILTLEKDRHCNALEPIEVPEFYGRSLIQDRIAIPAEMTTDTSEKTKVSSTNRLSVKLRNKVSPQANTEPDQSADTLIGTNILPALIEIALGKEVQLGEVVTKAHAKSGLSLEDWNALPEVDRDALLTAMVDELKAEASQQQP